MIAKIVHMLDTAEVLAVLGISHAATRQAENCLGLGVKVIVPS